MTMQQNIENKLNASLAPLYMQVLNESQQHNVPAGSESHFKVTVVAEEFRQQGLLARHRRINEILAAELAEQIHALAIHAYSPEEWQQRQQESPASPRCHGGSQAKQPHE